MTRVELAQNPVMNAMAAQPSSDEIVNVAAYFATSPGPPATAKSDFMPQLVESEMLRNEEWNYAVFTAAKQQRPGVNQAQCLACHKPLDKVSYTFTLKELTSVARAR